MNTISKKKLDWIKYLSNGNLYPCEMRRWSGYPFGQKCTLQFGACALGHTVNACLKPQIENDFWKNCQDLCSPCCGCFLETNCFNFWKAYLTFLQSKIGWLEMLVRGCLQRRLQHGSHSHHCVQVQDDAGRKWLSTVAVFFRKAVISTKGRDLEILVVYPKCAWLPGHGWHDRG